MRWNKVSQDELPLVNRDVLESRSNSTAKHGIKNMVLYLTKMPKFDAVKPNAIVTSKHKMTATERTPKPDEEYFILNNLAMIKNITNVLRPNGIEAEAKG